MSLLYRWSLPTRGFIRDKFQDGESSDRSKCPTIQIGPPDSRRRPDLSSAFSTLFVTPENRRSIRNTEKRNENVDDLPLLATRRENLLPETNLKCLHSLERQVTNPIVATSPPKVDNLESEHKYAEIGRTDSSPCLTPEAFGQGTRQINEMPKVRSFSLSSTETDGERNQSAPLALQSLLSRDHCERIPSASSSYPSEGIRSPTAGCRSPEVAIARTMDYFAEYRRYGQYPSQSSFDLFSMPRSEESLSVTVEGQIQASLVGHDITSSRALASPSSTPKPSPLTRSSQDLTESPCPSFAQDLTRQQISSSNSETTVPILSNEDSISSQLEVSFMSYRRMSTQGTSDDYTSCQVESREAALTDCLRLSEDIDMSLLTAVRRTSMSDEQDAWSTIRGIGEEPLSRRASWAQLFTLTAPRRSANTLSERIQKLRLRKWVKRVCFKTKARFELVGRPVSETKRASSRVRRRKWGRKKRKGIMARKLKRGPGKKIEKSWGVGKKVEARKACTRQHKRLADDFFGALAKRKNLRFGLLGMEQNNETFVSHKKRVPSRPASVGS
ncbi:hypothetical protein F5B17DRAFT_450329 [Nemania serpens]|nr:hypothetical protein F5B17DRAFT_450329 [Nemania serpens]